MLYLCVFLFFEVHLDQLIVGTCLEQYTKLQVRISSHLNEPFPKLSLFRQPLVSILSILNRYSNFLSDTDVSIRSQLKYELKAIHISTVNKINIPQESIILNNRRKKPRYFFVLFDFIIDAPEFNI